MDKLCIKEYTYLRFIYKSDFIYIHLFIYLYFIPHLIFSLFFYIIYEKLTVVYTFIY